MSNESNEIDESTDETETEREPPDETETEREPENILCNLCGFTCVLGVHKGHKELGGLIKGAVCGGFESTPGNGYGTFDDGYRYRFSLCEFCLDWLFQQFKIPVEVDSYMDDFCRKENESFEEAMKRTDGFVKLAHDPIPPPWEPAFVRVARDDWREMKAEFAAEMEKRAQSRGRK